MPRRRIDVWKLLGPAGGAGGGGGGWGGGGGQGGDGYGGVGHIYLQQLPCSWGQLFFPGPWLAFREYMHTRLTDTHTPPINIKDSACCQGLRWGNGGWSASWKKFLIELSYLNGYVVLYPNFANQTSFSTNHIEQGEHISGKLNALKHRRIDFTVPLMHDLTSLRKLYTKPGDEHEGGDGRARGGGTRLAPLAPLQALPTLDLFSERSSQEALVATGRAAAAPKRRLGLF